MIFLMFTGQGSQRAGMCSSFCNDPKYEQMAHKILRDADDVLNICLSDMILKNEDGALDDTVNTQPAIAVNAKIILEAIKLSSYGQKLLDNIKYTAGHSVGEYCAFNAIGALNFEATLNLLKCRGAQMQSASQIKESCMIACLECDSSSLRALLSDSIFSDLTIEIANDNGSKQIVLSGEKTAIDIVAKNYSKYGIKRAIPLKVSGAFHSSLMKPAAINFSKYIDTFSLGEHREKGSNLTNQIKLLSNVTAEPLDLSNELQLKNSMISQITSPVRWREIMEEVFKNNIKTFVEIGPSPVLCNLAKRHFGEENIRVLCISEASDIEKLKDFIA